MADHLDYSMNINTAYSIDAHSILVDNETFYSTKTNDSCNSGVFRGIAVAKVAPWSKLAPLYGTHFFGRAIGEHMSIGTKQQENFGKR